MFSFWCLFYLSLLLSGREQSSDSCQQIISRELSFQMEILERAPKDNSSYSVFKVWYIDGQLDRYQGNQGRVLRQITVFSHETMTKKRGPKCNVFGKIFSGCIDLDPSSKTLHHFDSCEKSLKSNLDSLTCNRSYIRKNPIERFGCGKPLSYSSSCSVPEKIHVGTKSHAHSQCVKVINHKQAHIQYKKVHVGKKHNVVCVGRVLLRSHSLIYIKEFILERNCMYVEIVEKPSVRNHTSLCIRGFTLGRNPMNVLNVGRPSPKSHSSLFIRESTLERNLMNVWSVKRPSPRRHISLYSSNFIPERSPLDSVSVVKLSVRNITFLYTR